MTKKNIVKVIHWGLNGIHYDYSSSEGYSFCKCSTYMNPEYFLPLFERGEYQKKDSNTEFAGSYVIDKEEILEKNPSFSVRAPLLNCDLPPRAINFFVSNRTAENGIVSQAGSMDYIGIELYVEYWRKAGAKIGKVQDDGKTIVWETAVNNQTSLF